MALRRPIQLIAIPVIVLSCVAGACASSEFRAIPLPKDAVVTGCSADLTRFCGWRVTGVKEVECTVWRTVVKDGTTKQVANLEKGRREEVESYIWDNRGSVVATLDNQGDTSLKAEAISADGSTVVARSFDKLFRWTQETGTRSVGLLPDASVQSVAISADGKVLAGLLHTDSATMSFVWTDGAPPTYIKGMDTSYTVCSVHGVSGDGRVVVGRCMKPERSSFEPGKYRGFRWTAGSGYFILPKPMASGNFHGRDPLAISEDASTTVGPFVYGRPGPFNFDWCVWSRSGKMQRLICPKVWVAGGTTLNSVSADGKVITGCGPGGIPGRVFYFVKDTATGTYRLHLLKEEWRKAGYPVGQLTLCAILRVSRDGKTALCSATDKPGARVYVVGNLPGT